MQKPSLGRIVLTPVDRVKNNGADVAPAIITRVWSDDMINVRVIYDSDGVDWKTSVRLYETSDDAINDPRNAGNEHMSPSTHWAYWPPRV